MLRTYLSDMPLVSWIWASLCVSSCVSCAQHYTPKPRGYFRIELPPAVYTTLRPEGLPCSFHISALATVEYLPESAGAGWINLYYPLLDARIYCSYLPSTPSTLEALGNESRALVERQSKGAVRVTQQVYENVPAQVYGVLYESDGAASPVQFVLTDSVANFFRGALVYNRSFNADSLAPVTRYLRADVVELVQSFGWRKK